MIPLMHIKFLLFFYIKVSKNDFLLIWLSINISMFSIKKIKQHDIENSFQFICYVEKKQDLLVKF